MKKILIVINNFGVGGAERLVVDECNELLRRNIFFELLTLKQEGSNSLLSQCRLPKERFTTVSFTGLFDCRAWFTFLKFMWVRRGYFIYSHLWFANTVVRIASFFFRIKHVVTFEHNIYEHVKNPRMFFVDRLLQLYSFRIVAVSSAVKEFLITKGIQESKIEVINNGINIELYKNAAPISRASLGLPPAEFVFLCVARLIDQKGIDILIEAFSKLSFAQLLLVGMGNKENEYRKLMQKKGVADRVHFLGVRQDIPGLLKTADCFVLASRYEGLGIVILEAMAAGKPIIVSDFGAVHDMIHHADNGMIVPVGNVEELANTMMCVQEDDILRTRISASALKTAEQFSIQNHTQKILNIYGI